MQTPSSSTVHARAALIAVNVVPLFGVLFLGWDLFTIMFLFWAESAVIAFYTILKLVTIKKLTLDSHKQKQIEQQFGNSAKAKKIIAGVTIIVKLFMTGFFIVHFGIFMAVHLAFIVGFFGTQESFTLDAELLPGLILTVRSLLPVIALMFVSHGISFVQNFSRKNEQSLLDAQSTMMLPYKRVVIMHITILIGGFLTMLLGTPVWALVLLIVLKGFGDLRGHLKEHARLQVPRPQQAKELV